MQSMSIGMAYMVVVLDAMRKNKWITGTVFAVVLLGAVGTGSIISFNEANAARGELNTARVTLSEEQTQLEVERVKAISLQEERDSLSSVSQKTEQRLEDATAALAAERAERADLEDARDALRAENRRYEIAVRNRDLLRERLEAAADSLSREKVSIQGRYDTLLGEHGALSETVDTLTVDVAFYRLAHESYERLEERTAAQNEYSDLAIRLCGSVQAAANCPTDDAGLAQLQSAYSRYLEAHEAALAAYTAYTTASQERGN